MHILLPYTGKLWGSGLATCALTGFPVILMHAHIWEAQVCTLPGLKYLCRLSSVQRRLRIPARLEGWELSFLETRTNFDIAFQGVNMMTSAFGCFRAAWKPSIVPQNHIGETGGFLPWRECLLASPLGMHVEVEKGTDFLFKTRAAVVWREREV